MRILDIQNLALFAISNVALVSCAWYDYTLDLRAFDVVGVLVTVFSSVDIFFVRKRELVVHHLCTLGAMGFNAYYVVDRADKMAVAYYMYKTEISSIFLVLKYWLPQGRVYEVNNVLFLVTFFKFRILEYTALLGPSSPVYATFDTYQPHIAGKGVFLVSVYGLYALNVYWFALICKLAVKSIRGQKTGPMRE